MKKYILILFLFRCQPEEEPLYCIDMIKVSNALPVQFWRNGVASFNQSKYSGVDKACWFQPWNAEDEIKIQFISDVDDDYVLVVIQNGKEIEQLDFEKDGTVPSIVNSLTFTPSDYDITGKVKLLIRKVFDLKNEEFSNSDFWVNFGTGNDFSISGGYASSSIFTSPDNVTKVFRQPINLPEGEYTFEVQYDVFSTLFGVPRATPRIHFYNGSTLLLTLSGAQTDTEATHTQSMTTLASPAGVTHVGFSVLGGTGTEYSLSFNYVRMNGISEDLDYTDLIDIKTTHANTRLINFTNKLPYAGLHYDDNDPVFSIRVLSKFFELRMQQEDESEPDAEGNVVKLSGSVKPQKQFLAEMIPPYMIEKLTLIFKHSSIWIENEAWIAEEALEIENLGERSPLFNTSVWLTRADDNFYQNVG